MTLSWLLLVALLIVVLVSWVIERRPKSQSREKPWHVRLLPKQKK